MGKGGLQTGSPTEMGLEQNPAPLLIGMVTRLADHKGLICAVRLFRLMERQVQFVLLGSGDGS